MKLSHFPAHHAPTNTEFMPAQNRALTLIEVLIVLGTVTILAALFLPMLSRTRSQEHIFNCISNLKQIGSGWLQWAHDHEQGALPFRLSKGSGGSPDDTDSGRNNAWFQFSVISNELNSPKVLVCPADKDVGAPRRMADNWSSKDTSGGFVSPGFRHLATSYTISLDVSEPEAGSDVGRRILGSDRNIQFDNGNPGCSSGLTASGVVRVKGQRSQNPAATVLWTNAIHKSFGNVLSWDGAVQRTSSKELGALCDLSDDSGSIHFLVPK